MSASVWAAETSHLFQALHVFEVESDVKKAEIGIYKLKLQETERPGVIKQEEELAPPNPKAKDDTYKNHFDDEIFLIGTLESIVFCGNTTSA